jgi:CCR4-NOT transcription complex subunit 9
MSMSRSELGRHLIMDHQLSYNAYQRSLYADTPSTIAAAIAHPTPHPPIPQFINDAHTLPHGLSPSLPVTNDENNIYGLVIDLLDPETREAALLELSKKREQYDDLALVLWHAFGQPSFS